MALLAILLILAWIFLWYGRWNVMLQSNWSRMGIGLALFIVPGFCIYGLLADRSSGWLNHITFGFVLSHLLVAGFGLLGRLFHAPFWIIKLSMMMVGSISLPAYLLARITGNSKWGVSAFKLKDILLTLSLLFFLIMISFIVIKRDISDDDLLYLTYLTDWKYSLHLDFNDLIFGQMELLHSRFWLMSTPFAQALLSDLSGLPGILLLGGYYEPFLVVIAMIGWYNLARAFQFSRRAATMSVIFQITFLLLLSEYIHPGASFFTQLNADKATATYILATVFIQSEFLLLRETTIKNCVLCLLVGLSLTFMHPISLAYLVFIGGLIVLLHVNKGSYSRLLIPLFILLVMVIPQVGFRFLPVWAQANIPYDPDVLANLDGIENMISRLGHTIFYGFNPDILKMKVPYMSRIPLPSGVLESGWLVLPALCMILVLRTVRESHTSQYIFSSFFLCAMAGIPFTGWILGYFLSAWMLERAVWFFPFGISTVFLFVYIRDRLLSSPQPVIWIQKLNARMNLATISLIVFTVFCSAIMVLYLREQHLPDFAQFQTKIRRYEDIARVGRYLDQRISTQAMAIGSDALNDLIPGVSWKAKLVTFRISDPSNMLYYTPAEIQERISARQTIFSDTASPDVKLELLRKYDIKFIVLTGADRTLFTELLARYPSLMTMEKVNRFFVIEIKDE